MSASPSPSEPFFGIFPPHWKVGQQWQVVMTTHVPMGRMPNREPPFGDVVFHYRVVEVPDEAHALYRIEVTDEQNKPAYTFYYRSTPFSLARAERINEGTRQRWEDNPPQPFIGWTMDRIIADFPIMPVSGDNTAQIPKFRISGGWRTQQIESTEDGIRFTLGEHFFRVIINWKRGQPWWSSIQRIHDSIPPSSDPSTVDGSGRLLP